MNTNENIDTTQSEYVEKEVIVLKKHPLGNPKIPMYAGGLGDCKPVVEKSESPNLCQDYVSEYTQNLYVKARLMLEGENKNEVEALNLLHKCALDGHAPSALCVGWCYDFGVGTDEDCHKAYYWYSIACDKGLPQAYFYKGSLYSHGRGVNSDNSSMFKNYKKAADMGDLNAQCQMGNFYAGGLVHDRQTRYWIVRKDLEKCFYWYYLAGMNNHLEAQYNLGWCYFYGHGVEQSNKESYYWYELAASRGHYGAKQTISNKMPYKKDTALMANVCEYDPEKNPF